MFCSCRYEHHSRVDSRQSKQATRRATTSEPAQADVQDDQDARRADRMLQVARPDCPLQCWTERQLKPKTTNQ